MTHTPITIFGSGAIGGTIGAQMQRAGHDVQFVDQALDHVQAINQQGLKISGFENFTVAAKALTPDKLLGPLGLVFLAVKSQDTDTALTVIERSISVFKQVAMQSNSGRNLLRWHRRAIAWATAP